MKALRYVRQIAQETSGEVVYGLGRQPAVLRTFSQRLIRYPYDYLHFLVLLVLLDLFVKTTNMFLIFQRIQ